MTSGYGLLLVLWIPLGVGPSSQELESIVKTVGRLYSHPANTRQGDLQSN